MVQRRASTMQKVRKEMPSDTSRGNTVWTSILWYDVKSGHVDFSFLRSSRKLLDNQSDKIRFTAYRWATSSSMRIE